jgi:predicted NACHT family NTPase
MSRSMRVAQSWIPQVKQALSRHGYTQLSLADKLQLSRSTINSFFNGKPVYPLNFIEISEVLGLDPKAIEQPDLERQNDDLEIDALVQEIRQRWRDKIQMLYSKMQLLDIAQPVNINDLYIEVNILEQITSQQGIDLVDLQARMRSTADEIDRLGIVKVIQKRVSALDAVKKHPRLMVLGKPGSGKTTFLQYLATECSEGKFQADLIPIFIRLKSFAKYASDEGNFRLLNYITRELYSCGISDRNAIETVLNHGKGLILLDGLDEVLDEDENEVLEQIWQFSENYFKNQLIITCRTAASKRQLHGFTNVEVADFNDTQIKSFVKKWFVAVVKNDQEQGKALAMQFIQKLYRLENKQIRELAVTPILLHLTCLVFQTKAEFPANRVKLYEQGLDILLRKWDEARGIQRDEVYRNLTLPRKKQLMTQVAASTFEQGDYFFEQDKIQQLIADYLKTLPNANTEPVQLQSDSEAVLKGIEAQHGLLVERARGIYSFSHLTFQEYFTARKIVLGLESKQVKQLGCQIAEKRCREVLLLALGMCKSADCLLLLMKQQIDGLVATDEKLQQFLMWLSQKPFTVDVRYKSVAVRAFYFALDRGFDYALDRGLDITLNRDLDYALDIALDRGLDRAFVPALEIALDTAIIPALETALDIALDIALDPALFPALDIALVRILEIARVGSLGSALVSALNRALVRAIDPKLRQALQELKEQLPALDSDEERLKQWLQDNGKAWTEQLRSVMISHRNIGYNWQFSYQQRKVLTQYYDANKFLVDCLNKGCNVTPAVREGIEETLLLPIALSEKRDISLLKDS